MLSVGQLLALTKRNVLKRSLDWHVVKLTMTKPKLHRDDRDNDSDSGSESACKATLKSKARKQKRSTLVEAVSHIPSTRPVSAEEEAAQRLLVRKSILQFSTVERREASFPQVSFPLLSFSFSSLRPLQSDSLCLASMIVSPPLWLRRVCTQIKIRMSAKRIVTQH
jgi:hypothetical protein